MLWWWYGFEMYHSDWLYLSHDDVIKWKHFPRYWPFVRGIHRSPVNSPHKGQWRGALMFTWICARINGWVNNREAGDFWRYRGHYDVIVMLVIWFWNVSQWVTLFVSMLFAYVSATYFEIHTLEINELSVGIVTHCMDDVFHCVWCL